MMVKKQCLLARPDKLVTDKVEIELGDDSAWAESATDFRERY